ncbi:DUF4249 domain-containing protein [Sunxiuqinia sp. A32]|uniref:DUF4249 domain-containing protein n=1 Tax=Sunxiuqinia sp. A32 TaxID=3461496 RepID=UPI004045E83A
MMRLLYIFILSILIFSACVEQVEIELDEAGDARLVVFAEITNDVRQHEVHLTKSAPYFSNMELPAVSNATVKISDGTKVVSLMEDRERPGFYLTPKDYFGVIGRTYSLEISDVDVNDDGVRETYTAETVMKGSAAIMSVGVQYDAKWKGWEVAVFSQDPGETEDFYLFKVYKNGILYTDSIADYWTTDDKFFNGSYINGPMVQYFDEEKGEIVEEGDTITLELAGITEEYFYFIDGVSREASPKVPLFSGPAANIKGNISNGALGFFTVMDVDRGYTIFHWKQGE